MSHMARQEGLEPADSGIRSSVLYPSELLAHVNCHFGVLYNFQAVHLTPFTTAAFIHSPVGSVYLTRIKTTLWYWLRST